jgi:spore coat protein U-like protein
VTCDATTSFTIALDTGSAWFAQRTMAGNAVPLRHNLYIDAARLIVWGVTADRLGRFHQRHQRKFRYLRPHSRWTECHGWKL